MDPCFTCTLPNCDETHAAVSVPASILGWNRISVFLALPASNVSGNGLGDRI